MHFDNDYLESAKHCPGVKTYLEEILMGINRIPELHETAMMMREVNRKHPDGFATLITQYRNSGNYGFENQLKATFYICRLLNSQSIEKKKRNDTDIEVIINHQNTNIHITTADMRAKEALQFYAHLAITSRLTREPSLNLKDRQLTLQKMSGIIPRLLTAEELEGIIDNLPKQPVQTLHIKSQDNNSEEEIVLTFGWVEPKASHSISYGVDHYRNVFIYKEGRPAGEQGYFFRLDDKIKNAAEIGFSNVLLIVSNAVLLDDTAIENFRAFLDKHEISGVVFLSFPMESFNMNLPVRPTRAFVRTIICRSSEAKLELELKKALPDMFEINPLNLEVVSPS